MWFSLYHLDSSGDCQLFIVFFIELLKLSQFSLESCLRFFDRSQTWLPQDMNIVHLQAAADFLHYFCIQLHFINP